MAVAHYGEGEERGKCSNFSNSDYLVVKLMEGFPIELTEVAPLLEWIDAELMIV